MRKLNVMAFIRLYFVVLIVNVSLAAVKVDDIYLYLTAFLIGLTYPEKLFIVVEDKDKPKDE